MSELPFYSDRLKKILRSEETIVFKVKIKSVYPTMLRGVFGYKALIYYASNYSRGSIYTNHFHLDEINAVMDSIIRDYYDEG